MHSIPEKDGRCGFVPYLVILFFIALVFFDGIAVYISQSSYSGVLANTESRYKKDDLAKNYVNQGKQEFNMHHDVVSFNSNELILLLQFQKDEQMLDLDDPVTGMLMRSVTDKEDMALSCDKQETGVYKCRVVQNIGSGKWNIWMTSNYEGEELNFYGQIFLAKESD